MTADTLTRGRWGGVVYRCANGDVRALARVLRQTEQNVRIQMRGRGGPILRYGQWVERVARGPQTTAIPIIAETEIIMEREQFRAMPLSVLAARFRELKGAIARALADAEIAEADGNTSAWKAAEARLHELVIERRAIQRVMERDHKHDPIREGRP